MSDYREKTLNIGCLGLVSIGVYADGYWNMILERKDGRTFLRSKDHADLKDGEFVNIDNLYDRGVFAVEGWMWTQFLNEVEELKIMWNREALFTPETKYVEA